MSDYIEQNCQLNSFKNSDNWIILKEIEMNINSKIEDNGIKLKNWNLSINRGILTGYNEAFIIDEATKNTLIESDPKSAEIIRPILRGKDIKKYTFNFANLWLIYVPWHFPLNNDSSIKGASIEAEKQFEKEYKAIYDYLKLHKEKLSSRNKAETGIRYEWYALQRWGANYWDEFSKQKLVWTPVNSTYSFTIIPEDYYFNNSIFMITGEKLKYLCGILNSKVYQYYFKQTISRGSYNYGSAALFSQIPIIRMGDFKQKEIENYVDIIIKRKKLLQDTSVIQKEIDLTIIDSLNLSNEEVSYIDSYLL